MYEFIDRMYSVDQNVIILVTMMCLCTTMFVNRLLDSPIVTGITLPLIFNCALAGIIILSDLQVLLSFNKAINLILLASIGILSGLLIILLGLVAWFALAEGRSAMHLRKMLSQRSVN